MIAVIDYGAGNLRSVVNAFEAIGQNPVLTSNPADLAKASAIVLPGVGAFGDGMASLRQLGLIEPLREEVLGKKKPYLGICLGLQFLGLEGFEHGRHAGLGWVNGTVPRIVPNEGRFRVPHIGWNNVHQESPSLLFQGLEGEPVFYFVHSFHLVIDQDPGAVVTSTCWHGATITASIEKDNIFGVQFHPEKSQKDGLTLLENFIRLI